MRPRTELKSNVRTRLWSLPNLFVFTILKVSIMDMAVLRRPCVSAAGILRHGQPLNVTGGCTFAQRRLLRSTSRGTLWRMHACTPRWVPACPPAHAADVSNVLAST